MRPSHRHENEAAESSGRARARSVSSAAAMERARAALHHAVGVGGLVLLEGKDRAAVTTLLQQTARDLAPTGNSLILRAAALGPDALARMVLSAFGQAAGDAPVEALLRFAESGLARGEPFLLMVEGAKALPAETLCWLASLTKGSKGLARVVLAERSRVVLLDALAGSGTCVDLVRLEADANVMTATDLPHLRPAPPAAPAAPAPRMELVETPPPPAAEEPDDTDLLATPAPAEAGAEAETPPTVQQPAAKVTQPEPAEPAVQQPAAKVTQPEPAEATPAEAPAAKARLYTIEEVLGKDASKILEEPAPDDPDLHPSSADSPEAPGTATRPDLPGPTGLETLRPRPSAPRPRLGPKRPPSPLDRTPPSFWSESDAAPRRDPVSASSQPSAAELESASERALSEPALVAPPLRPRRAVWLAVLAVLMLSGALFRLLGPSAGDRVSSPPIAVQADVAAAPIDLTPEEPPPAAAAPAPSADLLPAKEETEAPLAERRPIPSREARAELPPAEVEARVKRALDDLLEEDDSRIQEDALARLVEIGPQIAGPELVRQINARRRGGRTHLKLRALWKRVRTVLCDAAVWDPGAGPPPAELACPQLMGGSG